MPILWRLSTSWFESDPAQYGTSHSKILSGFPINITHRTHKYRSFALSLVKITVAPEPVPGTLDREVGTRSHVYSITPGSNLESPIHPTACFQEV